MILSIYAKQIYKIQIHYCKKLSSEKTRKQNEHPEADEL